MVYHRSLGEPPRPSAVITYLADRVIAPPGQEGVAAPVRRKCEASEAAQTGWWSRFKNISV